MTAIQKRKRHLLKLCEALKKADADIIDIIQFGSSVYAPDLALDVDLLITTRSPKDEDLYWDAFDDLDIGVDVIVRTPGTPMNHLAASVCLVGEVIFGNGETLKEVEAYMTPPTYERAQKSLDSADSILELAQESDDELLKDEFYRVAFNRLFDAARNGVMAFLHTENSRWGQLRRALPKPYDERFRAIVNTLHILYSYDGKYPKEDPEAAFKLWREKVEQFISDLEHRGKKKK